MAHPIRPESYISMDNFYTSTVYSKGAEIVGIYKTLLGSSYSSSSSYSSIHTCISSHPRVILVIHCSLCGAAAGVDGFKRGLKLYFDRFDGKAVTCDDFRDAMAGGTIHPSIEDPELLLYC